MKSKKLEYIEIYVKEKKDVSFSPSYSEYRQVERAFNAYKHWGKDITDLVEGVYSSWKVVPEIITVKIHGLTHKVPKTYLQKGEKVIKESLVVTNGLYKEIILN